MDPRWLQFCIKEPFPLISFTLGFGVDLLCGWEVEQRFEDYFASFLPFVCHRPSLAWIWSPLWMYMDDTGCISSTPTIEISSRWGWSESLPVPSPLQLHNMLMHHGESLFDRVSLMIAAPRDVWVVRVLKFSHSVFTNSQLAAVVLVSKLIILQFFL